VLPFALTVDAWYPVTAELTSGSSARSREIYEKVIAQFEVTRNPRYKTKVGANGKILTWCNIFVWDCTRNMCAEIPFWWMGKEQRANDMIHWLNGANGAAHGWRKELTPEAARVSALAGRPTVATWKNPVALLPGHMAMVLPDSNDLVIAQAGQDNFDRCRLNVGFGTKPVVFWSHA